MNDEFGDRESLRIDAGRNERALYIVRTREEIERTLTGIRERLSPRRQLGGLWLGLRHDLHKNPGLFAATGAVAAAVGVYVIASVVAEKKGRRMPGTKPWQAGGRS